MADVKEYPQRKGRASRMVRVAGAWTRVIVIIPVIGLLLAAVTLVVVGGIDTIKVVTGVLGVGTEPLSLKEVLVAFIEIADLFLLSIVLYIISLGLYELFIDASLPLPAWLQFNDLDDLKNRLVSVVIVVLAVLFLGKAIEIKEYLDLLYIGGSTGFVILALAIYLRGSHGAPEGDGHE